VPLRPPGNFSGKPIRVLFEERPVGSDTVLFLADQSCCSRPNEDWCPNVNLFEDRSSAEKWGEEHEVAGRVVTLEEGTRLGTVEWLPLVDDEEEQHGGWL
jgi:Alkylmercury lyase